MWRGASRTCDKSPARHVCLGKKKQQAETLALEELTRHRRERMARALGSPCRCTAYMMLSVAGTTYTSPRA